ncbi:MULTISPECIES: hypothetical protein [Pasteurellaceae]|uniref:Outer membrane protein n=1 Tax=Pasteurella atlantica TaxID=2827233 RepID=A0AAW8CKY3_9PAST|nr:hypothetical protein [Pasteurella atlantica]MBR0572694.1 hypothetical protein [Pasteurella atlantica]MDP8038639.1 hypothetical protein [Pasteurella atlantica]MDP8040731.1 hypothetical protein [Pasteurella atlantica]MDP8042866.1 hypothetical protein [Pasteurella atlantica]MDP8044953.1 hypothetical protein [Pasteurella atlantica]
MKLWTKIKYVVLGSLVLSSAALADNFNIKYSSNYLMPAYVHFKNDDNSYEINAKINIPLYKIVFSSKGITHKDGFNMTSYQDLRNDKIYSVSEINENTITYGRVKKGRELETVKINTPVFDLFTMAYQLSYFDKLPNSFQITNGKKIYLMKNIAVKKTVKAVKKDGKAYKQITYKFKTAHKDITVKKYIGEKFPRYISYNKDGDNYKLEFDGFVE